MIRFFAAVALFLFLALRSGVGISSTERVSLPSVSLDSQRMVARQVALFSQDERVGSTDGLLAQSGSPSGYPGSYRPVSPQPNQQGGPPCGHYGTPACRVPVTIPPGATAAQVYQLSQDALARHQVGQSLGYLEKSAQMGYDKAEFTLGKDYRRGDGEPRDRAKAFYWLDLASKQHNPQAQMELGAMYESGEGVAVDHARAMSYLKLAASERDPVAEYNLGVDYELGRGVAHDRPRAIQLLRQSSTDGPGQRGAVLAGELARANPATRYQSVDQIGAASEPVEAKSTPTGCPDWSESTVFGGNYVEDRAYSFCQSHLGCPVWENAHDDDHKFICSRSVGYRPTRAR